MQHSKIQAFTWLILLTISALAGFSQADYRKGYIILPAGDTLSGWIDYKGSLSNSRKCIFATDLLPGTSRKIFSPTDIRAYRFTDSKFYISKTVPTADSTRILFLEYLLNGKVDIYFYRDEYDDHYLIDEGNGKIFELEKGQKEIISGNEIYQSGRKPYVGLLKYIFRASPAVAAEVENIELDHRSLIKIGREYHNAVCSDSACIIYEKQLPKVRPVYILQAGMRYNTIGVIKNDFINEFYYFRNGKFEPCLNSSLALAVKMNAPLLNEKLLFLISGSYERKNLKLIQRSMDIQNGFESVNTIKASFDVLSAGFEVGYEFSSLKTRPSVFAGGFFNYYFHTSYLRKQDLFDLVFNRHYFLDFTASPFAKDEFGISAGVGCQLKISGTRALQLELKIRHGFDIFPNLATNAISLSLGFPLN